MISGLLLSPVQKKKKHLELGYNFDPDTYMDNTSSQQQKQDGVMEVPEIHGDLLIELLDASLAAENNAGHQQVSLVADDGDGDGDCWIDSQENYDIHAHQDCEDCGLDGMLSDFDEYGSSRLRSPAPPYVVFDHDDTLEWAETADADMDRPFTGECTGDWYMDGLVMAMAMEWEEQHGGSGFPFEAAPCYGAGGEAAAAEQVYASPLWE